MKIQVTNELIDTFREIARENKSDDEWALIESDDMFQSLHYCGGYDATERAFCFSYFPHEGSEYWFQLTLDELRKIVERGFGDVDARPAE